MRKIMLNIPDEMDKEITIYLLSGDMELRDKGRAILFAIRNMIHEDMSPELKEICDKAKRDIREKAIARWQGKREITE